MPSTTWALSAFCIRDVEDEIQDEALPEPSDLISTEDVFSENGVEGDDDEDGEDSGSGLLSSVPGPLIATATFVPTFVAIFFGLTYFMGGALQGRPTPSAPAATALMSDTAMQGTAPAISEALREPFVAPRVFEPTTTTRPADPREPLPREPLRGFGTTEIPAPAIESTGPSLPPAQPRSAISSPPEPRTGRPAEPPRQPQTAVLNTTPERIPAPDRTPAVEARPAVETRKGNRDWTPAAAFADREAASRLASSIQQQGYPVEIRQESSSSRPWVVWIGAQPRGGERRR